MGRRMGPILTTGTVSGVPSLAATTVVLVGAGSELMGKGATDGDEGESDRETGHRIGLRLRKGGEVLGEQIS
jgi:hypothetical protein